MIRRRNLLGQFIVYIVTFGLYMFYWYYSTLDEMAKFQGERTESFLWTVGMLIPIVNLFAMWKHASTVDKLTDGKYPAILLWLLWIFLPPALWILVQIELNSMADTPPTVTVA
jgi:ACR3 family arsenite efflux pump ArsB